MRTYETTTTTEKTVFISKTLVCIKITNCSKRVFLKHNGFNVISINSSHVFFLFIISTKAYNIQFYAKKTFYNEFSATNNNYFHIDNSYLFKYTFVYSQRRKLNNCANKIILSVMLLEIYFLCT